MASESEDPDGAATRLEAALERIAAAAQARPATQVAASAAAVDPEIAARLDALIAKLRGALPTGAA